jgi:hypothetical protein
MSTAGRVIVRGTMKLRNIIQLRPVSGQAPARAARLLPIPIHRETYSAEPFTAKLPLSVTSGERPARGKLMADG